MKICSWDYNHYIGGGFKFLFNVHPENLGKCSNFDEHNIFSDGLVQQPTAIVGKPQLAFHF